MALAFAVLAASMAALLDGAAAQIFDTKEHARVLNWVQTAVPKHPDGNGRSPPLRKAAVSSAVFMPVESMESNRSVSNYASELVSAFAYASGLRLRQSGGGDSDLNLTVFMGQGYAENGKLTDLFFSKNRFPPPLEHILRRSSGWGGCRTHVLWADPETIGATITVVDDRLSLSDKRKCIAVTAIHAFGLRVDPTHGAAIEDLVPRYLALAAARRKCAGSASYDELTRCITDEFAQD